ncbi:copper homeostasis protein CutC [Tuberibacillus sp. Marseille-P3662]|uniref:copper homeostasis protein CutC n=1 Tax=Tuberibacillus sp. Marseille-P3662 TaxID=1965358 RepID=UPI000A1CDE68|nr:copper homeostasis protein CutC [Tuberibacillus sp. Marseille-P3662]
MLLEVIATNVDEARVAAQNGADRIELIDCMEVGGVTPRPELIEEVIQAVNIPVNVMIRPHPLSFRYDPNDFETMNRDMKRVKQLNGNGIVIGALTEEKHIDEENMLSLLREVQGLDVTFHRAFDEVADQIASLRRLLQFPQIKRILTSGGAVAAPKAIHHFKKLVEHAEGTGIAIMAGSGLNLSNLQAFIEQTGVHEIHMGKGVRYGNSEKGIDPEKLKKVKQIVSFVDSNAFKKH